MNKKWLAIIGGPILYRLRRTQVICYLSLLLNIVFLIVFIAMVIFGR